MALTSAGLKNFRIDAFSVIADMYAEQARVVTNLGFDLGCLRMLECIPNQFAGNPINLILKERLQWPLLAFHHQPETRWTLFPFLRARHPPPPVQPFPKPS